MPADVVRVRLTTGKGFVNITCAVVDKLNYPLILGSDIVDKLNKQLIDESFVVTEMMNVVNENDDGHVNGGDDDDDDDLMLLMKMRSRMISVTNMKVKMLICLIHEKRLQRY